MNYMKMDSLLPYFKSFLDIIWYGLIVVCCLFIGLFGLEVFAPGNLVNRIFTNSYLWSPEIKIQLNAVHTGIHIMPKQVLILCQLSLYLLVLCMILVIIFQLRLIIATFVAKTPFWPSNTQRLQWIGYTILFGAIVKSIIGFLSGFYLSQIMTIPGMEFGIHFNLDWLVIFGGLIILIVAEFFRIGAKLNDDHDLTI